LIALVNHPGLKKASGLQLQTPSPPIGLAYIGGQLRKHGIPYTAVDACGEALDSIRPYGRRADVLVQGLTPQEVVDRIPASTEVVGFTCLFSHCWPLVTDIARPLREKLPRACFVAGGEHPSAQPMQVLADGTFDVVVLGEGEETFLELVRRIEAGASWRDVEGIAHRQQDGRVVRNQARRRATDIDAFPYPDWERWSIEHYIDEGQVTGINLGRSMPILGSRGCPYACTFCSNEQMWTRRYIMRSPSGLVDEMEYLKRRYHVSGFTFMDSTFVIDRAKTLAFTRELVARKLDVTYQIPAGTRCEAFDEELARALEASGLRNFAFAPESGSKPVLKAIRKQVDLDKLLEAVRVVLRTRMTVGSFFVVGFPADTPATLRETLALVRRLAWMGVHDVTVSQFTPYPGSADFDNLVAAGKISDDFRELDDILDFFSGRGRSYAETISASSLRRFMLWAFVNFYVISFVSRPWRLVRNLWTYFTRGTENARYVRFVSEQLVRRPKWKRRSLAWRRPLPGSAGGGS
jgi:anaerobic magnesium-protoporphyrin IX monomethyl ester cyclase